MVEKFNVEQIIRNPQGRRAQDRSETAGVDWHYAQTFDPYGVSADLPEEC